MHPAHAVQDRPIHLNTSLSDPIRRPRLAAWLLLAAAALPGGPTLAQTAGQITPPSFRPAPGMAAPGAFDIPPSPGLAAPEGAELLSVRVGRLVVEGAPAPLAAETAAAAAQLDGRVVTAAAIFAAAQELEAAYARAGRVLARVVVPPQTLSDGGDVRFVVVDGRVGRLDLAGVPARARGPVAARLAPLVGQPGLALAEIERRLLLAGDLPGLVLRSTLVPGEAPGETVLAVEARAPLLSGFLGYDNTLSPALGRSSLALGLEVNSALGLGEQAYLRLSGFPDTSALDSEPRNRQLAAGLLLPLGTDGWTVNLEAVSAQATPLAGAEEPGFTSDFTRLSLRLRYPLLRSRAATLGLEGAFDMQSERLELVQPLRAPISLDELRIARFAADGAAALPGGGTLSGRLGVSRGIGGLGAREGTEELPLSRQGARTDLTKAEAFLRLDQPVLPHLVLQLQGRGQTSFNEALLRSEQIGLVTTGGLSGFDAGRVQGDSGYVLRAEAQMPVPLSLGGNLLGVAPYVFGAAGGVSVARPSALERRAIRATAYGIGLRLGAAAPASPLGASFTVEYARTDRSDEPRTGDRLTFIALLRF